MTNNHQTNDPLEKNLSTAVSDKGTKKSSLALTSMILGIFAIFFGLLTGIPAVICGHVARGKIKCGAASGDGMALAGVLTGYVFSFLNLIFCGILIFVIFFMARNMSDSGISMILVNEMKFAKSSTYVLGKYLAKTRPNAKVLVIIGPKSEYNKRQEIQIDALKKGFGSAITNIKIDSPKLKQQLGPNGKPIPDLMLPMVDMMKAEDFNKLIAENKSCNLIITLIGLPMDADKLKIWGQFAQDPKKTPKLCIVNADISSFEKYIAKGLIPAVVTFNPDARYTEDPTPTDMFKAFDERYILITPKNVGEIARKYKDKVFRKTE